PTYPHQGKIIMPCASTPPNSTSEAAIFARLWGPENRPLPLQLARQIVRLKFSEQDRERVHTLAVKNQEGQITPAELVELDNYIKVGDLLALLQSMARRRLRRANA